MSALPDPRPVSISTAGYEDGLGRRSVRFDREVGGMLECLHLRPELRAFEASLRERAEAIGRLDDERFVPVQAIEREPHGLTVVSELIHGERLVDVIDARQKEAAPVFGIDAALGFLLQALPALSTLHAASLAHGLVSPGRVLLTPASQVVLLDTIYAAAVERLNLSRAALWTSLGILSLPAAGATRLDRQGDIVQASLCALVLATGKRIEAGEPSAIVPVVQEAAEVAEIRAGAEFAVRVRQFFTATLPVSGRSPVITGEDATFEARNLADLIGQEGCHAALADLTRADMSSRSQGTPTAVAEPRLVIVHPPKPAVEEAETAGEEPDALAPDLPEHPAAVESLDDPATNPTVGETAPTTLPAPNPVVDPPQVPEQPAPESPEPVRVRPREAEPIVPPPAHAPLVTSAPVVDPMEGFAERSSHPAPFVPAPPQPVFTPPVPPPLPPAAFRPIPVAPPAPQPDAPTAPLLEPPPPIAIAVQPPAPVRVRPAAPAGYAPPRPEPETSVSALPFVDRLPESAPRAFPWKLAAGVLVALTIATLAGRAFLPGAVTETEPTPNTVIADPPAPSVPPASLPAPANTGALSIDSQPTGARVTVDGRDVGLTPITVDALKPGRHTVDVSTSTATVRRTVRVEAGRVITLDVPVYSGWVAVFSPIALDVATGGRTVGSTDTGKIMLPPGRHVLTLSNREFGYSETRAVEIHAGEERPLNVEPTSTVNVNAHPWAEVWVDGKKAGDTPIANLRVLLGTRIFLFKHPQFGERRVTMTIKAAPAAISVDLTRPE